MTTVFDALHQTEDFVNELTFEWSARKRNLFNMLLLSQIVNSEEIKAKKLDELLYNKQEVKDI